MDKEITVKQANMMAADIKDQKSRELFLDISNIFYNELRKEPDFDEMIKKSVS